MTVQLVYVQQEAYASQIRARHRGERIPSGSYFYTVQRAQSREVDRPAPAGSIMTRTSYTSAPARKACACTQISRGPPGRATPSGEFSGAAQGTWRRVRAGRIGLGLCTRAPSMPQAFAVATDFVHAMLMAAWIGGLPLLFWHRWPGATRIYAVYAVGFVVVSQLSQWLLGECFLTNIALSFWRQVPSSAPVSTEWFTVRVAQAIFHLAPSHRAIVWASEPIIVATAAGTLWSLHRLRALGASATRASRSHASR